MAKQQGQVAPPPPTGVTLEEWMAARRDTLANVLLAGAVLLAIIPLLQLVLNFRSHSGNLFVGVWGAVLCLVVLFGGLYLKIEQPTTGAAPDGRYRLLALGLGGAAGLVTFLLGIALPLGPWAAYFVPPEPGVGTPAVPLLRVWKDNWWRIGAVGLATVGGLALMFLSLQAARGVERVSANMRRLLYGYNAVLTGLLLLAILGLVNVLAYVHVPPFTLLSKQIDWTPSQLYTLSPASVEILEKEVTGSVEILVLMPLSTPLVADIKRLIDNVRQHNKNINAEYVSPDANSREFRKIFSQYSTLMTSSGMLRDRDFMAGRIGVIVVYRQEGKDDAQFIPYRELFTEPGGDSSYRIIFKGEDMLMRTLRKLIEKEPTKVYFTKGHGELPLREETVGMIPGARGGDLAELTRQLEGRRPYQFKEVTLGPEGGTGLEDADVVVVARPTTPFSPKAVEALRRYVRPTGTSKKGKLIVLLDTRARNGEMLKTGLEGLLREFNVKVGNDRLLAWDDAPEEVPVCGDPRSDNRVAQAFSPRRANVTGFLFREPRRLDAVQANVPTLRVDSMLITFPGYPVYEESNLTASAVDLRTAYAKRLEAGEVPEDRKRKAGLTVAMGISETPPRAGLPAGHAPVQGEAVPRLVVFGDASWLTSRSLTSRGGAGNLDLFDSCISWLRGRSGLGKGVADPKQVTEFTLRGKINPNQVSRLQWLPLWLLLITIASLGGGIWLIRRR